MHWDGWLEEPVRQSLPKHNCGLFSEGCFSLVCSWVALLQLTFKVALLVCLYDPMQNLTLLKKLDLGNNRLSHVPALPPSLEVLRMNHNQLSTLAPGCFTGKSPESGCGG